MSQIALLSSKLLHNSHSVRMRAATNLIFKVKSDLLSNHQDCINDIFHKINSVLSGIRSTSKESKEFVSLVFYLVLCLLSRFSNVLSLSDMATVTATEALRLTNEDVLDHDVLTQLNEVSPTAYVMITCLYNL